MAEIPQQEQSKVAEETSKTEIPAKQETTIPEETSKPPKKKNQTISYLLKMFRKNHLT